MSRSPKSDDKSACYGSMSRIYVQNHAAPEFFFKASIWNSFYLCMDSSLFSDGGFYTQYQFFSIKQGLFSEPMHFLARRMFANSRQRI